MRPFNFLEALEGRKVITRNGEEVILTTYEIGELYPFRGAIIGKVDSRIACWTSDGCYSMMAYSSPHDIFMKED